MPLAAVRTNLGDDAQQVLADAGFRSEAVFERRLDSPSELIVALGREGKQDLEIDAQKYPHSAAMETKRKTPEGQAAYRKRKWIVEAPNGWIKSVLGFRQFSLRGAGQGQGRVQARLPGTELEKDVQFARHLREKRGIAGDEKQPSDPHQAGAQTTPDNMTDQIA